VSVRIQVPRKALWVRFLRNPAGRITVGLLTGLMVIAAITFTFYYIKYSRQIDRKLKAGPFQSTSMIFAAPRLVSVGDELAPADVVAQLRRAGYTETRGNRMGYFHLRPDAVEIFPGSDSYFDDEAGVVKFSGGRVSQIISLRDNTERTLYRLEPELITNLFDRNREKRRLVRFVDIPKVLVNAVVSSEDKRFFQHAGFDPLRIIKSAFVDIKERRSAQGGSTLSQQLARLFWLDQKKTFRRKAAEALITMHLEQRLSKEEIFEYYANQVPLGWRGGFDIRGFGEASKAYFGKDISQLTIPEAAMLAGLIQRPSVFNPFRNPDKAQTRRNWVLSQMRENGYITDQEYERAIETPLHVTPGENESVEAPYFVDLVNKELEKDFEDYDFQGDNFRIYTTLDLNLQRAAADAVRIGMAEVDQRLSRRKKTGDLPQVALVALDPNTGEVKALIGGRNYGLSQLNRALAKRQPGSSFKPFVYAAALNTALKGGQQVLTPATMILDQPTTFWFDDKPYSPNNFKSEFYGQVTLRQALAKSLNVPAVKLGEMVGYDTVETLAKSAGMNISLRPTPAIALGAYETTPLEVAGAYTIFADSGDAVKPNYLSLIRDRKGNILYEHKGSRHNVLDPRVSYLMTSLMEEVLRSGTGAGVRARGFNLPAAGKTGTSHDGWFAGFTSKLICVVWVGYDDNRELNLEGAHSALPIWAEFMKRAHQLREYRNVHGFSAPDGIVSVEIDPLSGQLATPSCPTTRTEVFIAGTQPIESCSLHGGSGTRVASWETPPPIPAGGGSPAATAGQAPSGLPRPPAAVSHTTQPDLTGSNPQAPEKPKEEKKKGLFHRIWGVFK
jgi:penicillin-binding protein 1B